MSLGAVIQLIESAVNFAGNPGLETGYLLSKTFIVFMQDAFNEDISTTLKKNIADSELEAAKIALDSIDLEAEDNRRHGINRVITHLESAFNLYNGEKEFESSCVCALYLSLMHKAIGNTNEELHKKIWLRVPLISLEAIQFGDYGSYVKRLLSEASYDAVLCERREERIKMLDTQIEVVETSIRVNKILSFVMPGLWLANLLTKNDLENKLTDLTNEKQLIQEGK